jgi:hypothetical protein
LVTDHRRVEQLRAAVSGWSIPTRVAAMDAAATRGDRLNLAAHLAAGHLVGILDEHGLYGPGHVTDLLAALTYTGAQLVGRSDRFVYDRDRDLTARIAPGTTDSPQSRLALGTLMLRRESALRCGFVRDEGAIDRSLIASIERSGGTAHSIHPFESLLPGRLDPARADQNDRATPGRDIARVLPFGDGGHPPVTEPT